jgi:hypothetical protein
MTEPAKCHCGSISWERRIEENRYICCSCKRPLWQPIETAPKDGTMILVWFSEAARAMLLWWFDDHWRFLGSTTIPIVYPTHWMPIPEGPGNE